MVNTGSLIPNLNDLATSMVVEEDNAPKYVSGDMKEHFSSEDLLIAWNKYAQDILKENKMSIYTLMHANEPVLKDNFQVEVIVDNRIQENLLVHEKVDLLNRLRVELQNFSIDLIVRYVEKNEKKQLYTSHDKYQHMVAKNPQLDDLRKRFNLDLS